jgi:hypothetical protein
MPIYGYVYDVKKGPLHQGTVRQCSGATSPMEMSAREAVDYGARAPSGNRGPVANLSQSSPWHYRARLEHLSQRNPGTTAQAST